MRGNRRRKHLAVHARYLRFTRGINLHQPEPISSLESGRELRQQLLRPREAMGLERDEQPPRPKFFEGLKGRSNLRRMMSVIIKNTKTIIREKLLLSPRRAAKRIRWRKRCRGARSRAGARTQ